MLPSKCSALNLLPNPLPGSHASFRLGKVIIWAEVMTIVTNAVVAADALPSITCTLYAARRDVAQHLTRHHLRPFHRGRAHARNRHAIAHAYVSPSLATAHALLEPQYSILPKECAHASFEPFRALAPVDLRRASHELARDDYPLPLPLCRCCRRCANWVLRARLLPAALRRCHLAAAALAPPSSRRLSRRRWKRCRPDRLDCWHGGRHLCFHSFAARARVRRVLVRHKSRFRRLHQGRGIHPRQ